MNRQIQDFTFICFSTAYWDAELWTNRQHIMDRISRKYPVLYIEPGIHSKRYFRGLLFKRLTRLLPWNWFREEKDNLWIYSPMLLSLYRFPRYIQYISWRIALRQIRAICRRLGFRNIVLWVYSPEDVRAVDRLGESLVLYDCVDNYAATPYYMRSKRRARYLKRLEERLLQRADIVATTSQPLWEEKKAFNPNTHFVQNVGDAKHFQQAMDEKTPIPADITRIAKPIVGFIGAVNDHKVDFALLDHMAQGHPEWQIVLIGPIGGWGGKTDTSTLDHHPNIHLMGKRPYDQLPGYIKAFDVCIIPYNLNAYTQGVFPIKFMEFLATGKPVVTTALPSLVEYRELASMANDHETFIVLVEQALAYQVKGQEERVAVALRHTWEDRVKTLLGMVYKTYELKHTRADNDSKAQYS